MQIRITPVPVYHFDEPAPACQEISPSKILIRTILEPVGDHDDPMAFVIGQGRLFTRLVDRDIETSPGRCRCVPVREWWMASAETDRSRVKVGETGPFTSMFVDYRKRLAELVDRFVGVESVWIKMFSYFETDRVRAKWDGAAIGIELHERVED